MIQDESFRSLYDATYPDVYRFVRSLVHRPEDVEEIVQEVYLKVAAKFEHFEQRSSLRTWMLSIARNAVIDHARRQTRQQKKVELLQREFLSEPTAPAADRDLMIREEARDMLQRVQQLPLGMRTVVMCRAYHDLSIEETARVMGWSAGRVRVTYSRALRKLRPDTPMGTSTPGYCSHQHDAVGQDTGPIRR